MAHRSKKALLRALEDDKAKLQESLSQLGQSVQAEISPSFWLGRRPYVSLGIGFGAGMVLALLRGTD